MFGVILLIVLVASIVATITFAILENKFGLNNTQRIIHLCCITFIFVSIFIGMFYIGKKDVLTSPEYLYEMLETKQSIQVDLEVYEEEIHNVLSGNVEAIKFSKKDQLIKLNSRIERFNKNVTTQRHYKECFWFSEFYNKDVANLELFPSVFNALEDKIED